MDEGFAACADALGLGRKLLYPLKEVEKVTGVSYSVLLDECEAGRLRYYLPRGRKQGRLVRPGWVDEWIEGASHGGIL